MSKKDVLNAKINLITKEENICPQCLKKAYKFGKTPQGIQRYRCKNCDFTFSNNQTEKRHTNAKDIKIAKELLKQNKSFEFIANAINKTENTVINLIKRGLICFHLFKLFKNFKN